MACVCLLAKKVLAAAVTPTNECTTVPFIILNKQQLCIKVQLLAAAEAHQEEEGAPTYYYLHLEELTATPQQQHRH